jgi:hypothetical protein
MALTEIKSGVFIAKPAIVMATCIREPERSDVPAASDTKIREHFILSLTLCNGSNVVLTDLKAITEICKELEIKEPKDWKPEPR